MSEPRTGTLAIEWEHWRFLKRLEGPQQWAIKYLYDRLNILDSKAGALMRTNGMIIGFLGAIVAGLLLRGETKLGWVHAVVLAGIVVVFALLAYAEALSFRIFALRFDRIRGSDDLPRYLEVFFRITIRREEELGRALTLSKWGTGGFVLLFVCLAVYELLRAAGLL
jgi:hypothetical protein